jgi:ABC-type nitrate/sulfonate/bicarbonate transport system ATPase subunit
MQQRVSIFRALIHNPSVLLMDEPFAALDAMMREELGFEPMRIWDTDKKTVIFVTHNITEVILLADRVVVVMSPCPRADCQDRGHRASGRGTAPAISFWCRPRRPARPLACAALVLLTIISIVLC